MNYNLCLKILIIIPAICCMLVSLQNNMKYDNEWIHTELLTKVSLGSFYVWLL